MKNLKWIIPIFILLLMWSATAFGTGTYRLFATERTTNTGISGPTQVTSNSNIYKLVYTSSAVCSLLGNVSGCITDTLCIFPVGSTLSAAWENTLPGYDVSGYKNFKGWVNLYDTTSMTDSVLNSYDSLIFLWQTSLDKKNWTNLDVITRPDTTTTNHATGTFSALAWTGQCAAPLAAPRFPNVAAAPEIGPYLRILAITRWISPGDSITYTHRKQTMKFRTTLYMEK